MADANASSPVPGRIGRYRIEGILGEGGFGRVYLACDDQLHRRVAVKVPHPRILSSPEHASLFLEEARVLADLDHPHVVPVFDVGTSDDGLCFVVSKLIEGSDLAKRMEEGLLAFAEVAELVAAVADALHHAHLKGLTHRDVKCGNILLDAAGKPYLADFGLVLREEDFGRGPGFLGTPGYMSPEQARGEGNRVDGRSDIFSLGVVLYELLAGRRPFRGDTRDELLQQITSVDPRPPRMIDDAIPKELERICLKALAKRPSDRYTTALDMANDLRAFRGEAVDRREGRGERQDRPSLPMPLQADPPETNVTFCLEGSRSGEADLPPACPIREGVLRLDGYSFQRTIRDRDSYLLEEQRSGRLVVVKVLQDEQIFEDLYPREVRNSRAALRIRHPAIVPLLDVIEREEVCYVVREHVEGITLHDLLFNDHGRLKQLGHADLICQVAGGLEHAHAQGLVHGQLIPQEVLIDQTGKARLSFPGYFAWGTPSYLAPEQVLKTANPLDGRADIWSLGVILYECLTGGRRPFGSGIEYLKRVLKEAPKPPRQWDRTIPASLDRICMKCLSRDLHGRYATAGDLAEDLRKASIAPRTGWRRLWPF